MSDPITPARFAAALQELPLSSIALKVAELRNSIAHLDYSNEQLKQFAHPASGPEDPDCIEAIQENEVVIERMNQRIELVREEVERRGNSWREFIGVATADTKAELNGDAPPASAEMGTSGVSVAGSGVGEAAVNGSSHPNAGERSSEGERHSAWTDGTFQTGSTGGGVIIPDRSRDQEQGSQGGRVGDDELRRLLEERMRADEEDEDGGMHL